jgi:glutaredoxin 3
MRIGHTVGAALTGRRALGPAENRVAAISGIFVLLCSVAAVVWPRIVAIPLAVLGWCLGYGLLVRAARLVRASRAQEALDVDEPAQDREEARTFEPEVTAHVRVFTTPDSPSSASVTRLLTEKGIPFEEIDVSREPERRAEMERLAGGAATLPQVFFGDRRVGGYAELQDLDRRHGLRARAPEAAHPQS